MKLTTLFIICLNLSATLLSIPYALADGYELDMSPTDSSQFYKILLSLEGNTKPKFSFDWLDCDYQDGVLDHVQFDNQVFYATNSLNDLCEIVKTTPGTGWKISTSKKGHTSTDIGPGGCESPQKCHYSY